MRSDGTLDATDARLLSALNEDPDATTLALARTLDLSRNTVQARLSSLGSRGALLAFERRVELRALGYPLTAFITVRVTQRMLDEVGVALGGIAEVLEVSGISGTEDLLVRVAGKDAEDLYRIAGEVLSTPGVERSSTALLMRTMVEYRVTPLLKRLAAEPG